MNLYFVSILQMKQLGNINSLCQIQIGDLDCWVRSEPCSKDLNSRRKDLEIVTNKDKILFYTSCTSEISIVSIVKVFQFVSLKKGTLPLYSYINAFLNFHLKRFHLQYMVINIHWSTWLAKVQRVRDYRIPSPSENTDTTHHFLPCLGMIV